MNSIKRLLLRVLIFSVSVLPDSMIRRIAPRGQRFADQDIAIPPAVPDAETRLFVGPVNSAGQGEAWARSAERLSDTTSIDMAISAGDRFGFPSDQVVPLGVYRWSRTWQRRQRDYVLSGFTHVLVESGRPLFGDAFGASVESEIAELRRSGLAVALVFHGSDIRLPSRHMSATPWSPFAAGLSSLREGHERRAARLAAYVRRSGIPAFYSTPDLSADVPGGTWLPVVVDPARWSADRPALDGSRLPIVAHAPSNAAMKGSDVVDPILARLADEGLLEYRRVASVRSSEMPALYGSVDVVLDQFRLGSYGVAAVEAMAAGRVVLGHVTQGVRATILRETGRELPIVEADPGSLESVLREALANLDSVRALAADGPAFVADIHDGRRSAAALAPFLLYR